MANPFVFGRPVVGKDFLNRKGELTRILDILASKNNLILTARRQVGKTSLLLKVKDTLHAQGAAVVYLDLFLVKGMDEFLNYLLREFARAARGPASKIAGWLGNALRSVRPVITLDERGLINASVGMNSLAADPHQVLGDVVGLSEQLAALNKGRKKTVVILDEFQRIAEIGGVTLEKKLRAIMQRQRHVNYVFSGSNQALLEEAFQKDGRPFFEWGVRLTLGPIPPREFYQHIKRAFARRKIAIPEEMMRRIFEICDHTPNHVQMFFFHLWNLTGDGTIVGPSLVDSVEEEILVDNNQSYQFIIGNLSEMQVRFLKGLAVLGGKRATSSDFLHFSRLKSSATALACARALIEKNIVEKAEGAFQIKDPFFKLWLKRLP